MPVIAFYASAGKPSGRRIPTERGKDAPVVVVTVLGVVMNVVGDGVPVDNRVGVG